jgi:hypothetical protein
VWSAHHVVHDAVSTLKVGELKPTIYPVMRCVVKRTDVDGCVVLKCLPSIMCIAEVWQRRQASTVGTCYILYVFLLVLVLHLLVGSLCTKGYVMVHWMA